MSAAGEGVGEFPELGDTRDCLSIWDEAEGPLTGLGAQRRPCLSSSLLKASRPGGLLAWLSPVQGQGSDEVTMRARGAGSSWSQRGEGALGAPRQPPGNTASLSQGLSRLAGGGGGGCGFCLAAGPLGFPAPGGSHAGRSGKVTKPLSPVEKGVRPLCAAMCSMGTAAGCWPLRLPGDGGLRAPLPEGQHLRGAVAEPGTTPRTLPACSVTVGSAQPPLGCHQL